jgi:hypothetical protein
VPVKGRMLLVVALTFDGGKITAVDALADRDTLTTLALQEFGDDAAAE